MTDREREICSRVRAIREQVKWSQIDFAKELGITRAKLAAVEYGHTPVRFDFARGLCRTFDVSLKWLVTGIEPQHPLFSETLLWTAGTWEQMGHNPLLSALYDYAPRHFDPDKSLPDFSESPPSGFDFRESAIRNLGRLLFEIKFHDTESAWDFYRKIYRLIDAEIHSQLSRGTASRLSRKNISTQLPASEYARLIALAHKYGLTSGNVSVTYENVKAQWPVLKTRLQKATQEKGRKTALADFLGVKVQAVSQWLTDSKNAREPGAETTLQMLYWVELQERK